MPTTKHLANTRLRNPSETTVLSKTYKLARSLPGALLGNLGRLLGARGPAGARAKMYFRLLSASGPRAGLPGPVLGRFVPEPYCERIKNRSQIARAEGPGSLGSNFGPFALGFRTKAAQNRPRKSGPGTGSNIN